MVGILNGSPPGRVQSALVREPLISVGEPGDGAQLAAGAEVAEVGHGRASFGILVLARIDGTRHVRVALPLENGDGPVYCGASISRLQLLSNSLTPIPLAHPLP